MAVVYMVRVKVDGKQKMALVTIKDESKPIERNAGTITKGNSYCTTN